MCSITISNSKPEDSGIWAMSASLREGQSDTVSRFFKFWSRFVIDLFSLFFLCARKKGGEEIKVICLQPVCVYLCLNLKQFFLQVGLHFEKCFLRSRLISKNLWPCFGGKHCFLTTKTKIKDKTKIWCNVLCTFTLNGWHTFSADSRMSPFLSLDRSIFGKISLSHLMDQRVMNWIWWLFSHSRKPTMTSSSTLTIGQPMSSSTKKRMKLATLTLHTTTTKRKKSEQMIEILYNLSNCLIFKVGGRKKRLGTSRIEDSSLRRSSWAHYPLVHRQQQQRTQRGWTLQRFWRKQNRLRRPRKPHLQLRVDDRISSWWQTFRTIRRWIRRRDKSHRWSGNKRPWLDNRENINLET